MISILDIGAICGIWIGPPLNERIGRKGTLLLNNVPNIVGTILLCVARKIYSIELFAVARFIIGVNCGVASGVMGLFLTEISPTELRGLMGSLQGWILRSFFVLSCLIITL